MLKKTLFTKTNKFFTKLAVFALCLCLAACATMFRGTVQSVSITSNVAGGVITVDGVHLGSTPFSGQIDKGKSTITVTKEGYVPVTITLKKDFDILCGIVANSSSNSSTGTTTDLITGAFWVYNPSSIYVQLQPLTGSNIEFQNELLIRKFAMMNHSQIAIDAGTNGGEYIDALADLMKSKMDKETAMLSINDALEKSKGDQLAFGNELIEQFQFRN